jgi:hypothetical protein
MAKGIDRAVPFSKWSELIELRNHGYTFIGRYLSKYAWKALTKTEARRIALNDLYIVSVYQNSGNGAQFFTTSRGVADAKDALIRAISVGQPKGSPIYFAVDFDAYSSAKSMSSVYSYFAGVLSVFKNSGYDVGIYGSYGTVKSVRAKFGLKYVWQTLAWSKKKVLDDANLYQWKIDTPLPENARFGNVDLNESNGAGGGWKPKV